MAGGFSPGDGVCLRQERKNGWNEGCRNDLSLLPLVFYLVAHTEDPAEWVLKKLSGAWGFDGTPEGGCPDGTS